MSESTVGVSNQSHYIAQVQLEEGTVATPFEQRLRVRIEFVSKVL